MEDGLLLGVDTCGPVGSIALGRVAGGALDLMGEALYAGGELSVSLVQGIADLLGSASLQ